MNIRILIFSIFCLLGTAVHGQTLKAYITAAEESLAEKDYYSAFIYYGITVEIDSNRADLRYKMAEAARMYHAYGMAERMYQSVVDDKGGASYPDAAFWLGQMQHIQGRYDTAISSYQIFLGEHADEDTIMANRVIDLIDDCQWAIDNTMPPSDSIKVEKLDSAVNTNFSEVAALKRDEIIYFTRLGFERMDMEKKHEVPPTYLYSRVLQQETDSLPVPMDSTLNDSLMHTAHTTFTHEEDRVYYTICEYLNKYDIRCDIFFRDIDLENDVWGEAQKLPEPINMSNATNTQPSIAYDDLLGKDVLYFVSDREGGNGGLDIYFSVINDDNTLTEPENLSALNTEDDDITPFFHEESNRLFFSSNGYPGFGGYDIYEAEQNIDQTWNEPINLGSDYNSSYNDVYFSLTEDESFAMFSSNKTESIYLDSTDRACCYDIYKVEKEPIKVDLIVETFNAMTGEPLLDVTLYIEEANGEVVRVTQTTGASNRYEMDLRRNRNYTVTGEKRTFNPDTKIFSTYDITKSRTIRHQLYLDPSNVIVEVRTFELRRRVPLINVMVDLTDDQNNLLDQKSERYSHIQYFSVRPDEDYGLMGWRKGYLKAFGTISRDELIGKDTLVKELYLELGNLEDFLPLAIYFDNDQPRNARDVRYLQTYDAYYGKKDEFSRRFTKGLDGDDLASAEGEVTAFFDDGLKLGKEEFEAFLNILDQYLAEQLSFKIFLKGYASPLASEEYNALLGERRIKTIQNEFAAYKGGVLQQYFDSGDLEVTEKSFGEGTAPPGVSDDARDLRQSIYSPGASRERRVEIIEIQKDNPDQQ